MWWYVCQFKMCVGIDILNYFRYLLILDFILKPGVLDRGIQGMIDQNSRYSNAYWLARILSLQLYIPEQLHLVVKEALKQCQLLHYNFVDYFVILKVKVMHSYLCSIYLKFLVHFDVNLNITKYMKCYWHAPLHLSLNAITHIKFLINFRKLFTDNILCKEWNCIAYQKVKMYGLKETEKISNQEMSDGKF